MDFDRKAGVITYLLSNVSSVKKKLPGIHYMTPLLCHTQIKDGLMLPRNNKHRAATNTYGRQTMELQVAKRETRPILRKIAGNSKTTRKIAKKWDCPLTETLVGHFLVMPLTSVKQVHSEETEMNLNFMEYIPRCSQKEYALFSIRTRSGERLATLGLDYDSDSWHFDQCYGPGRSEVLEEPLEYLDDEGEPQTEWYATELFYVGHEVVRLMNASGLTCH